MKQSEFEIIREPFWQQMRDYLWSRDRTQPNDLDKDFPALYRQLAHDLAIAKSRQYSFSLIESLNNLVKAGYQELYGRKLRRQRLMIDFVVYGFPAALRANAIYLWVAFAVFAIPFLVLTVGCYLNPELIYSVMSPAEVRELEAMYDNKPEKTGRIRQSDSDVLMFGYYIMNNIGIAFRCFATGIFFGIGSLFTLFFNGLVIGAVQGHLVAVGYGETFFPFVIGHGSFELTAIVFSGAAGLKLGFALLAPVHRTRSKALAHAARDAIKIIYGVFIMLMIAAFIEAFWSSTKVFPNEVRYIVGSVLWVLVIYYCFYFARDRVAEYGARDAAQ
ncbi:MAG: stage II sporulation protein M [Pseudomonadota bacterium]